MHGGVALIAGDTLEQQVQSPLLELGQRQGVDHEVMPEAMDLDSCQPALIASNWSNVEWAVSVSKGFSFVHGT